MDSYENEASKFAAQRTKLKNICEAHDLTYTFIKNSYPIKLIIRPIKGVGEQMSMLETASEDSYISPDAYLLFTMKDGVLVYRMSKTFTIEDQQRRCCGYHLGGFQLAGLYLLRSVCGVHPDRPAHHAEQGDVLLHRLFDRVPDMDADVRHL